MIQTFSMILDAAEIEGTSNSTPVPEPGRIQSLLTDKLDRCEKILRWAIVRIEHSGDNSKLWCEGAYQKRTS